MSRKKASKILESLPPDQGIVLEAGKTAAFRDNGGELKIYSAICTHLGCTVIWNSLEKSFDCPCHGSRFSPLTGNVINGPANKSLDTKE